MYDVFILRYIKRPIRVKQSVIPEFKKTLIKITLFNMFLFHAGLSQINLQYTNKG